MQNKYSFLTSIVRPFPNVKIYFNGIFKKAFCSDIKGIKIGFFQKW